MAASAMPHHYIEAARPSSTFILAACAELFGEYGISHRRKQQNVDDPLARSN